MSAPLLWQPLASHNINDPYPMYRVLRETEPIHHAQTKEIIVSRYDDVKTILKSDNFHTGNRLEWLKRGIDYMLKKDEDLTAIYDAINSFVLMLNPPQHTRIRNLVGKAWDNREVDQIIESSIARTLAQIQKDEFDAVADFAQPLSVFTISDILGVDGTQHRYLKDLGTQMTKAVDLYPSFRDLVQMNDAARAFIDFFAKYITEKVRKPDNALLSKLIQKNNDPAFGLSHQELISIAIFLFIAGQETSSALIGNGINLLIRHPSALQMLRERADMIGPAVEEILRYDSPVQLLGRITAEDFAIGDTVIAKDAVVTLVVGSANRDRTVFDDADTFNIQRKPNRHLSFGSGIHFCLGDWLGRRQAQIAIAAFFNRYQKVELASIPPVWNTNLAVRSLQSLPVKVSSYDQNQAHA